MRIILACTIWLASFPPICAQQTVVSPPNLTQEQKARILKKAYELNGNSMKGATIDMSDDEEVKCFLKQGEVTGQSFFECPQPEKIVKTEKIIPKENFENRFLVPPPTKKRHGP